MKNTYFCKCGRIVQKSTDADNTGNRDVKGCTGCPYLLPYGEWGYVQGEGMQQNVKGYECRVSQSLEYASLFSGCVYDMGTCYVVSLDYDFLEEVSDWIKENYPDGELSGSFSRERIRPTDFSISGRYKYPIYCAKNKKGMAAKAALQEHFFEDRRRKGMTREEEEKKIKDLIENGKRAAQGGTAEPVPAAVEENATPAPCLCESCTCTGCHEVCFGHCQGCGNPTSHCNSYQTGGEKFLSAAPAAAATNDTTEALTTVPDALPAFDYSGLDAETATHLQNLSRRALESKQRYYLDMMEIIYEAHLELVANCDKRTNQYSEATFRAWCASIGVSKDAAYRLLQVQALMDNSTPEEQEILEQAQPSLLYAAAKPSAPAEAVSAVKSGDITTLKEYKELMEQLMAEQAARESAEQKAQEAQAREEEARAAAHRYHVEKEDAEAQRNAMIDREADWAKRIADAQAARSNAEQERDAARDMLEKSKRRANHLMQERDDALEHLDAVNAEMDELRTRPIEVAVAEPDQSEIERIANERAESIAAQRTALLEAQMRGMQQDLNDLRDSAYQAQASGVDTVFAFAANAAGTIDTLRETFLQLAEGLQEDDFWDAFKPLSDAAWKIANIETEAMIQDYTEGISEESEAAQA